MSNAPKPGSYIDTQGMGAPMSAEDAANLFKTVPRPNSCSSNDIPQ